MRRTKTVLAVVAVMAAMLVALAAPALADNNRHDNNNDRNHNWFDNNNRHDDWFDHRDYDDDDVIFVSGYDIDDFYYPYWGWGYYPYLVGGYDCGYDWGGPVNPYDCFD